MSRQILVSGCFTNNPAFFFSLQGALYVKGAISVEATSFFSNQAPGTIGLGGAVYCAFSSTIDVSGSTFQEDSAGHKGASSTRTT
jgi:predicted outer membrane repeat protein